MDELRQKSELLKKKYRDIRLRGEGNGRQQFLGHSENPV